MNRESLTANNSVGFIRRKIELLNLMTLLNIMMIMFLVVKLVYSVLDYVPQSSVLMFLVIMAVISAATYAHSKYTTNRAIQLVDRYSSKLNALLHKSKEVHEIEYVDTLFTEILDIAIDISKADGGTILMLEEDKFEYKTISGVYEDALIGTGFDKRLGLAGEALRRKSPVRIGNVEQIRQKITSSELRICGAGSVMCIPLIVDNSVDGVLEIFKSEREYFTEEDEDMILYFTEQASLSMKKSRFYEDQKNFEMHFTNILVEAVEKEAEKKGHVGRVAKYSLMIGHELGMDEEELKTLHRSAVLHDIGFLKIDLDDIKSVRDYHAHSKLGYDLLNQINFYRDIAHIVLYHHEWYNGSGYPEGLVGEEIPLMSRIIAIAEAYDAMTSSTSYKITGTLLDNNVLPDIVSSTCAITELQDNAGRQFDPSLVEIFARIICDDMSDVEKELYEGIREIEVPDIDLSMMTN